MPGVSASEIARPLRLAADGEVIYMESRQGILGVIPESNLGD
jgi:hypothetical protein